MNYFSFKISDFNDKPFKTDLTLIFNYLTEKDIVEIEVFV